MSGYRATVERNGQGWLVTVQGVEGFPCVLPVPELVEVEYRTRRLIWGYLGGDVDDVDVEVEVLLPRSVEVHLELAGELCEDAGAEIDRVIEELTGDGYSLRDVEWILRHRRQAAGGDGS